VVDVSSLKVEVVARVAKVYVYGVEADEAVEGGRPRRWTWRGRLSQKGVEWQGA